jgi:hypothetical protein
MELTEISNFKVFSINSCRFQLNFSLVFCISKILRIDLKRAWFFNTLNDINIKVFNKTGSLLKLQKNNDLQKDLVELI